MVQLTTNINVIATLAGMVKASLLLLLAVQPHLHAVQTLLLAVQPLLRTVQLLLLTV
jgi:hypothetical protein